MKYWKVIGTILLLVLLLGCIRVEKAPQPETKAPTQPLTKTPEPVKKTVVRTVPAEGETTSATTSGTTATSQQTQSSGTTQGSSQTSGSSSQTTTSATTSGTTTTSSTTSKPKNIVATTFTSNVSYDGRDALTADVKNFEKGKTVKFIFKNGGEKIVQFVVSHSDPAKFKVTEAVGTGNTTKRSATFPEAGDYTLSVTGTGRNVAPITLKVA